MKNIIMIASVIVAVVLGVLFYYSSQDVNKYKEDRAQYLGIIKELTAESKKKDHMVDSIQGQVAKLMTLLEIEKKNKNIIVNKYEKKINAVTALSADESILFLSKRLNTISEKDSL